MKGSSKVIMIATIAIVIVLGIVLGLVIVLLAQLYYSLLFRKQKLNKLSKSSSSLEDPTPSVFHPQNHSFPSPLSTFYAQGVLHAPTNFLFPKENDDHNNNNDDIEKQKHGKLHQFLRVQNHHQIGLTPLSTLSSLSPCYMSMTEPHQPSYNHDQVQSDEGELVYISNPIYDNHEGARGPSPAVAGLSSSPGSLPLSPIEELGQKSSGSVGSGGVVKSIGTSNSECKSRNGSSYSSSPPPCTSLSW